MMLPHQAAIAALIVFLLVSAGVLYTLDAHDEAHAQLKNAYWPYSVETVVRDR